ncbi:ATP-dependent nuclease [Paenalcaligenes hermetiae]|uniref:ATP-dependent endonuclease n=1 Tax=Paenalcaligenes hermetiae TaxID=1157987 RepID=A0ABP9LZ96_9BURK
MQFISLIKVKNFKSIQDATFRLEKYTPIVGQNNAGKSNIIASLKWLLKKEKLGEEVFYDRTQPIEVEGVITGITEDILNLLGTTHREKIVEFIENQNIKIKRIQDVPNAAVAQQKLMVFHPADKEWKLNPTGIENAIKAMFPESIEIGAMVDVADDVSRFKKSNTIGRLVAEILTEVEEAHAGTVKATLQGIKDKFSADGSSRADELTAFDEAVSKKLQDIFPGIDIKLHVPTPELSDLFSSATIRLFENQYDRDISLFGHGTQRSVQMALIRHLAEIKQTSETKTRTLLLIDEPELYLHPQAMEQVRASLKYLSENGYQVVFSTHSPQMIPAEDIKNTLLIRKTEQGTHARKTLKEAVEQVEKSSSSQYQLLFSLENANQILFSESVVLSEGKTEKRLLPYIFEKHFEQTLGQKKIAFIEQGGVNNTVKALEILKEMDIPCKAIIDLDFAFQGAIKQGLIGSDNESISKCKTIFSSNNEVKLNNGLPTKGGNLTAAQAYEWLAKQDDAKEHIQVLHDELKEKGIWLWKLGAIEPYLGIDANTKREQAWAGVKQQIETSGLDAVIKDVELTKMLEWLCEPVA